MGQNRRVLLADDDPEVQKAVRRVATKYGYEIRQALTATEARRIATEELPDLIVLDIVFPDGDGRDVLSALKQDPRTAQIPVLVWSGRDAESDRKIALSLGAEDYVEKTEAQTLLAKIKRLLLRLEPE